MKKMLVVFMLCVLLALALVPGAYAVWQDEVNFSGTYERILSND